MPNEVRTRTFAAGSAARIFRVASMPSSLGIMRSIMVTSGRSSLKRRTASMPFSAFPTTRMPGSVSMRVVSARGGRCGGRELAQDAEDRVRRLVRQALARHVEADVLLDLAEAPARVTARDTFGQAVACPPPGKGLVRLPVPSSGYLEIAY